MLRMPSSQPPTELSTIVSAGRIACWAAEAMNGAFQPTVMVGVGVVALAGGQDVPDVVGEEVQQDQREPEVRHGGEQRRGRDDGVQPGAALPAGQRAEPDAEREADHRRHADQDQRPVDGLADLGADRGRELADRQAQPQVHQAVQVLPVLVEDVAGAEAEQRGQDLGLARRRRARLRHPADQRLDRVAGDELRQQEVDGERRPGGDAVEPELAGHVPHARAPPLLRSPRGQSQSLHRDEPGGDPADVGLDVHGRGAVRVRHGRDVADEVAVELDLVLRLPQRDERQSG